MLFIEVDRYSYEERRRRRRREEERKEGRVDRSDYRWAVRH